MSIAITSAMISELRDKTSSGILDCKKALVETGGDIEKSIKWLLEKGLASSAKKTSKITAEGLICVDISSDCKSASIIEVNCQTDFVAKVDDFKNICDDCLFTFNSAKNVDASLVSKTKSGETLENAIKTAISKTGENIKLRRGSFLSVKEGFIASYVHNQLHPQKGSIGVLLAISTSFSEKEKVLDFGKKIAMHIASMNPISIDESGVSKDAIEREKEIFTSQALQSGKPQNVVEKMIDGRIKKFLSESSLLSQSFVMDSKITVGDFVSNFAKQHSTKVSLDSFVIFKVGDGIEKTEENFANEVASMIKK
jgi:elongation factor Ts